MKAPTWAKEQREHERSENRAARVAALFILKQEGCLPDVPKKELARRLGISRWTLDRDLSSVPEVEAHINKILSSLTEGESQND